VKKRKTVFSKKIKIGSVLYDDARGLVRIKLAKPYQGQVHFSVDGTVQGLDGESIEIGFSQVVR
jgi:hypothetical protein